ncbi:FkbM family methyltransferase [Cystobacter fuscus]|uniref:FkbM family methyltransferase n=1 Tax=Cystobacter fuscus TaxID=43 RepID=UPI002B2FDA31|nr:FkbM family methyltransferase [Cystobacter fuscus]
MYTLRTLFQTHLVKPKGVIYAGAHIGENIGAFLDAGFESVLCLEPNPEDFALLERNASKRVLCLNAAVSDQDGVSPYFMVPGVPTLNSTLAPDQEYWKRLVGEELVAQYAPTRLEVPSFRLDTLMERHGLSGRYNVLYMNIQGGELLALRGAPRTLESIDTVFTELNFERRYEGCALFEEVDAFLREAGFRLMYLEKFPSSGGEHGEALYRRISSLPRPGVEPLNELENR